MSFSLTGGKNKSKSRGTVDQTQTNTLSDRAAGILSGGIADLQGRSYQAYDPASASKFSNPYQQDVIDASLAQLGQADAQAFNGLKANLAGSGGFGNERRGIMEGELAGQQSRDRASLIAGLNAQNHAQAQEAALGESQNSNAFQLQLQALINQLRGGFTNEGTQKLNGVTTGKNSGYNLGFGASWSPAQGFNA